MDSMGFGFPAAIGAQMGFPDKLVIDIAGDGSIQMCIQELATAVCYGLPVKIVILNNGYLGMVYIYDLLDPSCAQNVSQVGGLLHNGLAVIAGKLDKEVQWMRVVEKNVSDLPVSVELGKALTDIETAVTYFRQAATLFPPPPQGRQPGRQ